MEWKNDNYIITDNREDLDVELIHHFLQDSYWAEGIPREVVEQSIEHSLCFGLFHDGQQIGFARAVTDRATFAYLADVFVIHDYHGRGLGKWLVSCIRDASRSPKPVALSRPALMLMLRMYFSMSRPSGLPDSAIQL